MPAPSASLASAPPTRLSLTVTPISVSVPAFAIPPPKPPANSHRRSPGQGGPRGADVAGVWRLPVMTLFLIVTVAPVLPPAAAGISIPPPLLTAPMLVWTPPVIVTPAIETVGSVMAPRTPIVSTGCPPLRIVFADPAPMIFTLTRTVAPPGNVPAASRIVSPRFALLRAARSPWKQLRLLETQRVLWGRAECVSTAAAPAGTSATATVAVSAKGVFMGASLLRAAIEPLPKRYRPQPCSAIGSWARSTWWASTGRSRSAGRSSGRRSRSCSSARTASCTSSLADDLYAGAAPVTAVTQVQRQVSNLRKVLGAEAIETRAPGYVLRTAGNQLDLHRFERGTEEGARALARSEPEFAADLLSEALGLWRGPPLADLAYEAFAQAAVRRLEELRLAAFELRLDADLACGRHAELVGELEELAELHPLHERFRKQLMLALYRTGRQADALAVYRGTRQRLSDELGIEPTRELQALERAILAQDLSLDLAQVPVASEAVRAVLVHPQDDEGLDALLTVAEPLARFPGRELILVRSVASATDLGGVVSALNARRASLAVPVRVAAFTTADAAADAVRLATRYDVELVLLNAPKPPEQISEELRTVLERSAADVALLSGRLASAGGDVYVPFGGGEHDWAALELGARLAAAASCRLRLVGTTADPSRNRPDASRLLADASLAIQRLARVESDPVLIEPNKEALAAAVEGGRVVVVGISPRWRREGIGTAPEALVRSARLPTLLMHRGPRPGALAPRKSSTRFTWSIEDQEQ